MAHDYCPVKKRLEELIAASDFPDPKVRIIEVKSTRRPSLGRAFFEVKQLIHPNTGQPIGTKVIASRPKEVTEYHMPSAVHHLVTPYVARGLVGVLG